jgi:hypothetical protein
VRRPSSRSWCTRTCCATLDGFKLANDGRDTRALQHYLGHKNIQHTVRYTELSPSQWPAWIAASPLSTEFARPAIDLETCLTQGGFRFKRDHRIVFDNQNSRGHRLSTIPLTWMRSVVLFSRTQATGQLICQTRPDIG